VDESVILDEVVADGLAPVQAGGITLYPAAALPSIFAWADEVGRTIEWLEGAFYNPVEGAGQLSLSYICERGADGRAFVEQCLRLATAIQCEAAELAMGGYFEIGVSACRRGS
jgi:hypothetical protein